MNNLKSKTNIVVSCWNALEHTKITLERLFETVHHEYVLTVVNNNSTDGTKEYLEKIQKPKECEKIVIINNQENLGAGEAINQGHAISVKFKIKYTCLCNNDLYFKDNWLLDMENEMEKDSNLGILGTLRPAVEVRHHLSSENTKVVVDSTPKNLSIAEELRYFQGEDDFDNSIKKVIEINGGGIDYLRCPPNAVITCCAIVRTDVSDKIGFLSDPQFKIYGSEDLDLSWRLSKHNYKCAILKSVYVHHFRHRSINKSNLDREKYLLENNIKFLNKWKKEIYEFLDLEKKGGIDIYKELGENGNPEYLFLKMINSKTQFVIEYNNQKHHE